MQGVPSLFSLCVKTIELMLIQGCHHVQDIFELPSDLLDSLMMNLPPLALQNIHELSFGGGDRRGFASNDIIDGRKRGRYEDFNSAWKIFFKKRWPNYVKKVQPGNCVTAQDGLRHCKLVNHNAVWQQIYWEAHLQNCLDEAAERALLPTFDGDLGALTIPDSILTSIGQSADTPNDFLKLSYHCSKFGRYARCLRLQNVLCVPEICILLYCWFHYMMEEHVKSQIRSLLNKTEARSLTGGIVSRDGDRRCTKELLRTSELQALVFRRITCETHVNGLCMLLNRNRETLLSLEFIHCKLSPTTMDHICSSVFLEETQTHGIQSLCLKSSSIFESKSTSIAGGLLSFLSSGRSLSSVYFSDTRMGPTFAKMIFDILVQSTCGLATLEIIDDDIAGWLCKVDTSSTYCSLLLGSAKSLKSLSVLNLRGNNLCKDDAEDLNNVLVHLPNLRSLDISDNPIRDDGIRSLIPYFVKALEKPCPLSELKMENCCLSGMGVAELLSSLPTLREPLNTLSIADNDLGSSVAASLAKFVGISCVRVLNIEDIGLGPLGFEELEKEMPKEMALISINISKNRGGIRSAYFISKVILQSPNLVSADAGYNIMPPQSLEVIHDALKQAKGKLEKLNLLGNTSLCQSMYASRLLDFQFRGKPIVTISSFPDTGTPYDDDP